MRLRMWRFLCLRPKCEHYYAYTYAYVTSVNQPNSQATACGGRGRTCEFMVKVFFRKDERLFVCLTMETL